MLAYIRPILPAAWPTKKPTLARDCDSDSRTAIPAVSPAANDNQSLRARARQRGHSRESWESHRHCSYQCLAIKGRYDTETAFVFLLPIKVS